MTVEPFTGKAKITPASDSFMLEYQAKWIRDRSLIRLMQKSRRIGITYATSYDYVREHALVDAKIDTWFSSRDDLAATEFIRTAARFARLLDKGAKLLGTQVLDDRGSTGSVLRFSSQTRINSVASNPDVYVSKGGNVGLDEFATRQDPKQVFAIASPVIEWGGRMSIISTHRGSGNFFNKLVTEVTQGENPKGISLHTVTLQNALDQGFLWKLQSKLAAGDPRLEMDEADFFNWTRNRCADQETFLQEYCCVPDDDASAFLPWDWITACEYPANMGDGWRTGLSTSANPLFLGMDIGRTHDLTVIFVVERIEDMYFVRFMREMRNSSFDEQESALYSLLDIEQVQRACIDQNGIGMQLAERAIARYPGKVEGFTFTNATKEALAYPLKTVFEGRKIRIPESSNLRADLRSVRREHTASNNIRFAGDRTANGHADRFWSLALAIHAGKPMEASVFGALC